MKIISVKRALHVFWEELFYLKARLQCHPKTAGLVGPVEDQLASFEDILHAEREMKGAVFMMKALAEASREAIKEDISLLYLLALSYVRKDKTDDCYAKLIKIHESTLLRYSFEVQKAEFMRMTSVLRQTIYEDGFRDEANEVLERLLSTVDAALADARETEEKCAQYRVDANAWKVEANNVRLRVYSGLILFEGSHVKTWARGFFM